ncbi:MAG: DNA methyltransferase, partial [Phycisphaerae bacterium]
MDELVDQAIELRLKIESMPSNTVEDVEAQARLLAECERKLAFLKCVADMLVAAELKGGSPKERMEHRDNAAIQVGYYLKEGKLDEFRALATKELGGRRTFHWPLEFPEVFAQGGFSGFVGNPPFMGGSKISGVMGDSYRAYLVSTIAGSAKGNADLCAFFYLRAASLLATDGIFGLVATNTVAQGDTREVGLDRLVGGHSIIRAVSSLTWPGEAVLEVAAVWLTKSKWHGECILDGSTVIHIGPSLAAESSATQRPHPLIAQSGIAFNGTKIYGDGFVLTPEEAASIQLESPESEAVLFPYLNGDDFNSSPHQSPSRCVINFGNLPMTKAAKYEACFERIRRLVKPYRDQVKEERTRTQWWLYERPRLELYRSIASA